MRKNNLQGAAIRSCPAQQTIPKARSPIFTSRYLSICDDHGEEHGISNACAISLVSPLMSPILIFAVPPSIARRWVQVEQKKSMRKLYTLCNDIESPNGSKNAQKPRADPTRDPISA